MGRRVSQEAGKLGVGRQTVGEEARINRNGLDGTGQQLLKRLTKAQLTM